MNEALREWRQGDVGRPGLFVSLACRELPLESSAAQRAQDEDSEFFLVDYDGIDAFVVVSQTCDVVRAVTDQPGGRRYWVQVAPLVRLEGQAAADASAGRAPRFAPVPAEGQDAFADLDRCTTIEKAVLVQAARSVGCPTDEARRRFGDAAARNRGRFAFPDEVDEALGPLKGHMRKRQGKNSPEGRCVEAIAQIRAESDREWGSPGARVTLHFIVDEASLPAVDEEYLESTPDLSGIASMEDAAEVATRIEATPPEQAAVRQALWQRLTELWAKLCTANDSVAEVAGLVSSAAEFTLAMMRTAPQLDLDHLSPSDDPIR